MNLTVVGSDLSVGKLLHVSEEVNVQRCQMEGKMDILEGVNSYHLNAKNISARVLKVFRIKSGEEGLHFHAQVVLAKMKA